MAHSLRSCSNTLWLYNMASMTNWYKSAQTLKSLLSWPPGSLDSKPYDFFQWVNFKELAFLRTLSYDHSEPKRGCPQVSD